MAANKHRVLYYSRVLEYSYVACALHKDTYLRRPGHLESNALSPHLAGDILPVGTSFPNLHKGVLQSICDPRPDAILRILHCSFKPHNKL